MPACFSSLPPEISTQIIRNVGKSCCLLDLALCCRSLYHLTLPYIYSDITMFREDYEAGFPYLKPFTIHILRNPELASLVRGFALHQCWGLEDFLSKTQGIGETIQEVVSKSSLSQEEQEKWTGSLENGDQDAYVALLLSSLPNLERLDLVLPALLEDCFKKVVNSAAMKRNENIFQPQQAFSSLRVVINDCDRNVQYTSPKLLSEYLRLPSLREFYGHKIRSHCEEASDGLATLEPATVPLVHLELRNSKLNMIDMTNILRAFKHLKTFVYEVGWGIPTYSTFSTPEIGKALSWTESSLENLWLDCKGTWNCCFLAGHVAPVKTLSSFKVLKNLRVDMYIFFGDEGFGISPVGPDRPGNTHDLVSILPASIETLYFSHTKRRMKVLTSALEKLLQAKEWCTPKLRRIAFEADITGMDDAFDYSRLDFLAGEGGVKIAKIDNNREERGRGKDGSLTASILSGLFSSPSVLDFEYLYMTRPTHQTCHQT